MNYFSNFFKYLGKLPYLCNKSKKIYHKEDDEEDEDPQERPLARQADQGAQSAVDITEKYVFDILRNPRLI